MGHIGGFLLFVVLLLGLSISEAAQKIPRDNYKHATQCKDPKSRCFHLKPYCPQQCPTSCQVDCKTCQLACTKSTLSPPPPKPQKTKSPPPPSPTKSHAPPTKPYYPPTTAKKVRCMNKKYPLCYYKEYTCPASCLGTCEVDCITCGPVCRCDKPGAVCQDPRFVGADGITFYFHGKREHEFCLVADSNLHINAHFIGKRNHEMKRDFTWVQSLGILFDHHQLYIGALKTATWSQVVNRLALSFDGEPVYLPEQSGATWTSSDGSLTIKRTENVNEVEMEAEGQFKIKAVVVPITTKESRIHNYGIEEGNDVFAHLDLTFKFSSLTSHVSGVLGQTYAPTYVSRVKMGVSMPVLGGDDHFSSSSLFSTDCAVARFSGNRTAFEETYRFNDLNCATGGLGAVCKR